MDRSAQGMPPGTMLSRAFMARGMLIAYLTDVRTRNGRIYADCMDPDSGSWWNDVPVNIGAGSKGRTSNTPLGDPGDIVSGTAPQVILDFRTDAGRPVVIGTIEFAGSTFFEETGEIQADGTKEAKVSRKDFVWINGGSLWQLDYEGEFLLQPANDKSLRVQLAGEGRLRVFLDGDSSDRAVLGAPLKTYLEKIEEHSDAQDARIDELERALTALAAKYDSLATTNNTAGTPVPLTPLGDLVAFTPPDPVSYVAVDDSIKSKALHLPAANAFDEGE